MSQEKQEKEYASFEEIMSAYQSIMNSLLSQEKAKTKSKNLYEKSEALQEVMIGFMEHLPEIEKGKEFHYIRRAIGHKMADKYDHEKLTEIFAGRLDSDRTDFGIMAEHEMAKGYGLTRQYISDILKDIKQTLTASEFEIWHSYCIEDKTGKQIAEMIGETEVSALRKVKRIFDKLQELHVACFIDERYNALVTKKRIQAYYPPAKGDNSEVSYISPSEHVAPIKRPLKGYKGHTVNTVDTCFFVEDKPYVSGIFEGSKNREYLYLMNNQAQVWKEMIKQ